MKKQNFFWGLFFILTLSVFFSALTSAVKPFGANVTEVSSQRAPADTPQSVPAQAGNVTELNIFGYSTTQSWQGYFGNITGTIQLADANDNVMYNWSLANPQGEIYASRNDSLSWSYVQCLNFSSDGTYADDTANAGGTSLHGTNLTQLEDNYNISSSDVDGVDETFNLIGPGTHDLFYTANLEFSEGECRSTRVYSNAGTGESNKFEEALLYEPVSRSVIFATIIDSNLLGFDNKSHDFEMMVLEDGHGTDTAVTNYYFYVELE